MGALLQQLNQELAAIVERVRPGLVQITTARHGMGAGIVWHSQGLIVTNAHVIRDTISQITLADGRVLPAQLLGIDRALDLAALAVNGDDLPTLPGYVQAPPRPGQWVVALGHPWGVVGAATAGVVIAVGIPPEMPHLRQELIQVSLHVRPGYSGGPLVDEQGQLLGITTMMAGPDVGLAIPCHVVTDFVRHFFQRT